MSHFDTPPREASGDAWASALWAPPAHVPPRVLVADDDDAMRHLVAQTLSKDGFDVLQVSNGGRLLVALAREIVAMPGPDLVDLLVSDIRMPVCTGIQILEQIRASGWRMPVILMTAFGDAATRERAAKLGALLLDKPFEMDTLRLAARHLLRQPTE